MAETFKAQQQVIHRKKMQNGSNLIRVGQILSFADGGEKARVNFPADDKTELLPVTSLSSVKGVFGATQISNIPSEQQVVIRGY